MNCNVDMMYKLKKVNCPFVTGDDVDAHWWLEDMLFKPGEARISFLQWLFTSVGINCNVLSNCDCKTKTEKLTILAVRNGLCLSKDKDLITGLATKGQQTAFISYLLDLLSFCTSSNDETVGSGLAIFDLTLGLDTTLATKGDRSKRVDPCLWEVWNCMNKIVANDNYLKSKNAKINVKLPIGLQMELKRTKGGLSSASKSDDATKLREETRNLQTKLNEIQSIVTVSGDQNLRLDFVMKELKASASRFVKLYDDELRFWCRQSRPQFSSLGACCASIEPNLNKSVHVTDDIDRLQRFYIDEIPKFKEQLLDIEQRLSSSVAEGDNLGPDLFGVFDTFSTILEKWAVIAKDGNFDYKTGL